MEAPDRSSAELTDAADEPRELTAFERQLAAVRAGAPLVTKFRQPSRSYDHITLGGVGSALV